MKTQKAIRLFTLVFSATLFLNSSVFASVKTVDGNAYTWIKNQDEWYCIDEKGVSVNGWILYNGDTYYLDKDGSMRTGWCIYKNAWYYLDEDSGKLQKEQWIDNYYVNKDGKMTKIR